MVSNTKKVGISRIDSRELARKSASLRLKILQAAREAGGGHIGGSFSVLDIIFFLYSKVLRVNAENPSDCNRDRLIFSKGHASLALYACLEEFGFLSQGEINTFNKLDSRLAGHSEHFHISGIEITTGSLGHGLGVAAGIALAARKDNADYRVYCVLGDGECNEGSVWESLLFIRQWKLTNLITIIDYNKMESLDFTDNILSIAPLSAKIKAFGFRAIEFDGHDFNQIAKAIHIAFKSKIPCVLIANTVKGKGITFMENSSKWHYRAPNDEEFNLARGQLEGIIKYAK